MKTINEVPSHKLVYQLRRLQRIAKEVAYAKNESDAEYFTVRHLRPEIEKVEKLIGKVDRAYEDNSN